VKSAIKVTVIGVKIGVKINEYGATYLG